MALDTEPTMCAAAAPFAVITERACSDEEPGSPSNLAALLDQFTATVTHPEAHTIGMFARTVEALHGELALLARHFEADAQRNPEAIDFEFDDTDSNAPNELPIEPGIAASEELEHLCRELSRPPVG